MSGPGATMYSAGWDVTLRDRIDEANKQNIADMNAIGGSLSDTIAQGLGLYSDPSHQQQFNEAYAKANELMNNSRVAPGSVDFSNYNPYMSMGSNAANELQALSGLTGLNSQQIYDRYLNNSATQAQLDQGNRQINSNYAAQGLLGSGALLKALQSYGQDVATQGIGRAQQNLYNMTQLGAQAANQYTQGLLNKYQTDQQAALGGLQNQANLYGQQVNLLGQQNQAYNTQANFLANLAGTNAQLQAQAANQRQSSLANSATKYTQTDQMGWGGARGSMNTSYRG